MFTVIQQTNRIFLIDGTQRQVEIFPFGALLNAFAIRLADGSWHNAVAAYSSPEDAQENLTELFRSAKLSPFVCRLANAHYTFSGSMKRISKFLVGNAAIHGLLFDTRFAVQRARADAQAAEVWLGCTYDHEDEGYPFCYQVQVCYRLAAEGRLTVSTHVQNLSSCSIPIADGWHTYFAADGDMASWKLQLRSSEQLVLGNDLLPTGERVHTAQFSQGAPIADARLDNCFVLNNQFDQPAAVLQGRHVRLSITPDASYPFLQVFTPLQHSSIALENLSSAPDAFNNGIGLLWLEPQQVHTFRTEYRLETIYSELK